LYETGKGGLWRDPELQLALKWKAEQNTNAVWASRYNDFYDKAIFFLEHSRQKRDMEIQHKEELQKQRLRITRRISIIASVVALLAILGGITMFQLEVEASKDKKIAEDQSIKAMYATQKANTNKRLAEKATVTAIAAKDSAEQNRQR